MIKENLDKPYKDFIETRRTQSTRKKYSQSIEMFFQNVFDKKISEITFDDLNDLHYSVVYKRFIKKKRNSGMKDSTIKTILRIVSSFIDYLRKEDVFRGLNYNKLKKDCFSTESLNNDIEHIHPMSKKDLLKLKKWFTDRKYRSDDDRLGEKYAKLVDFMFVTAIRSSATFKIKWNQFSPIYNSAWGGSFVDLIVIDKGNKRNKKPLTVKYYNELKELFYKGNDSDLVFGDLNKNNLRCFMSDFSKENDIIITPHSIKVGAGTYVYSITKDIVKTSRFLDHESVETTMKYIRDNDNPNESGSVIASRNFDYSKFDDLNKEQLLTLIKNREEIKSMIYSDAIQVGYIKERLS